MLLEETLKSHLKHKRRYRHMCLAVVSEAYLGEKQLSEGDEEDDGGGGGDGGTREEGL